MLRQNWIVGMPLDLDVRKGVFVERNSGIFEPRTVETGARLGDSVVITSGLTPGERIVVSGNFLIDSESRFQLAAAPLPEAETSTEGKVKDPVCGMQVEVANAAARCALVLHTADC